MSKRDMHIDPVPLRIDTVAEDIFALNLRGLRSIGVLWRSPKLYFDAARHVDWRESFVAPVSNHGNNSAGTDLSLLGGAHHRSLTPTIFICRHRAEFEPNASFHDSYDVRAAPIPDALWTGASGADLDYRLSDWLSRCIPNGGTRRTNLASIAFVIMCGSP